MAHQAAPSPPPPELLSEPAEPASGASASSSSTRAARGRGKVPEGPAGKRYNKRYYTVTRVPEGEDSLLGIHHSSWQDFEAKLGHIPWFVKWSELHLKGFAKLKAATEYWCAEGWEPPSPLHR